MRPSLVSLFCPLQCFYDAHAQISPRRRTGLASDLALCRLTSANDGHYLPAACHLLYCRLIPPTSSKGIIPDAC